MAEKFLASSLLIGSLLMWPPAWAQNKPSRSQDKPTVITLMPAPSWQMTGSAAAGAASLASWGGDPAIETEYGVSGYTARSYRFVAQTATALLEQASDPSAAYGLLTFYRTDAMKPMEGMAETLVGADKALLARSSVFIRVSVEQPGRMNESEWRRLVLAVGGPPPTSHALEELPQPLPKRGLVPGSEKYLLGPVAAHQVLPQIRGNLLGFQDGAEVQTAQYKTGQTGKLTLAAIEFPTPQLARAGLKTINESLAKSASGAEAPPECRRQDAYVLVVMNAPSRQAASRFLDGFRVTKEIEEDEASRPPSDVWQLVQLLIANGVLIMLLVGASLGGGIIVCVAKRLARKWFANSLFVEGEGCGIIMLDLR